MLDDDPSDRTLVRPYVKPGAEPKISSIHTEEIPDPAAAPSSADEPPPGEDSTAVLPVVEQPPPAGPADNADRRMVLWLVGAGLALILIAAVAVIALWPGEDEPSPAAQPGASLLPAGAPPPTSAAARTPSPSAKASPSASAMASPSRTAASATAGSAPAPPPPASPSPSATLAPPPAADRAGAITGSGGHCLDVRGGIALPGGAVSAYACNGTPSQRWTLGVDGTLRVGGMCAAPDGSAVHLGGCDASAQWRAGSGGTLVNVSTARCLTDPSAGATTGDRMTLAVCGGAGQRWALP